jgi:predicted house-cleaning noncanonical NTP pyrophosphatase (MazG superfamily)
MKFRKFQQNKLWRDKLVERMELMGSKVHWTRLDDAAFSSELKIKFMEEAQEVHAAQTKEALLEELADVLEVISSFCDVHDFTLQDIMAIQEKKRQDRGGFKERKFVTIAEHQEDSFGEKYCLADPNKYPEIKEEIV